MFKDFSVFLWLLKFGALVNLYFLASTLVLSSGGLHAHIVLPAQVLFAVSAYRCLFPVWYKGNVVFHDSPFSSIFLTRLLATFAELAFIYQLSHVIRLLNLDQIGWVNGLSWVMVVQVAISQVFVWGAILTERLTLYFYEELGWAVIFAANTLASAFLYLTVDALGRGEILVQLSLLFGVLYLPWQCVHLRILWSGAVRGHEAGAAPPALGSASLAIGLRRSIRSRNRTSAAASWGGLVGLTWMVSYWASLIPIWVYQIVRVFMTP
jgi:hypothetical protein